MSFAIFNIFGYLSVLLWLAVPVLWWLHRRRRPRRWLCHYAVLIGLLAYVLAVMNSRFYVNRIQVDQSDAIAAAQARQAEARQRAEQERAGDVAQIRFAEDDDKDFLDMGGLDAADRKYIQGTDASAEPQWKQQKKQRSSSPAVDDSLEGQLDTTRKVTGADSVALGGKAKGVVILPAKMVALANRLDGLNLLIIRWVLLSGIVFVVVDYLGRVNRLDEAYFPLPLPSALVNGLTPIPVVNVALAAHPRTCVEDLASLVRRGDTFVLLTDNPAMAAAIPEQLPRLPLGKWPFQVLHVGADDSLLDDSFIFEGIWYNRAAFVIDSAIRAESFLTSLYEQLVERHQTRARVRQTVHIVWNLDTPLADMLHEDVIKLVGAAGMSLREV